MWKFFSSLFQVKKLFLALHLLWLLTIIASLLINHLYSHREIENIAIAKAKAVFNRDLAFRNWASAQGGVYVPISGHTPPNPYLANHHERDIQTPSGQALTLMNPAYMIRQINEKYSPDQESISHITSLHPLRPENKADEWEAAALRSFTAKRSEILGFMKLNDKPYLRYMQAVSLNDSCLKCHKELGDLGKNITHLGGMSISLPIKELMNGHKNNLILLIVWHLLIYLAGAVFLFRGNHFITARVREQILAQETLEKSEERFRTVADFAYAWEYWLDPDGSFLYISPSVEELTGYAADKFLADPDFIKTMIKEDNREILHDHLKNGDHTQDKCEVDFRITTSEGEERWMHHICRPVYGKDGKFLGRRASNYDITEQKQAVAEKEYLIDELQVALAKVKLLSGFLPICASCKKIRDDEGYWGQIEEYITEHSEAVFSHGICPDCCKKLYPDYFDDDEGKS